MRARKESECALVWVLACERVCARERVSVCSRARVQSSTQENLTLKILISSIVTSFGSRERVLTLSQISKLGRTTIVIVASILFLQFLFESLCRIASPRGKKLYLIVKIIYISDLGSKLTWVVQSVPLHRTKCPV